MARRDAPGIVHRLDRDTSGLIVVAKTDLAHRRLGAAIAARRIHRGLRRARMGASGSGSPTVIEAPLARHPQGPEADDHPGLGAAVADGRAWVVAAVRRRRVASPSRAPQWAHPPDPGASGAHWASGRRGSGLRRGRQPAESPGPLRREAEALERATPRQALHAAVLAFRHPATG